MINKNNYLVFVSIALIAVFLFVGWIFRPQTSANSIQVLFIGNSFTSVNDLPKTVAGIAKSLGDRVIYDASDAGGLRFSDHVKNQETLDKIKAKAWNFVVLQDQSQLPSFQPSQVAQETTPYALALDNLIHQANPAAKTVFYETWGYKDGDSDNCPIDPGICTYAGMQSRLIATYTDLAAQTSALLAPVGQAWSQIRQTHPEINLYQDDGKHPSSEGTYLAACVFYETLFQKSVIGASPLNVKKAEAEQLQQIAHNYFLR